MEHWHLHLYDHEEDPLVTTSIYEALESAAEELRILADSSHEGAHGAYEQKMWAQAACLFVESETWSNLANTAEHPAKQHNITDRNERAPLFRNWHIDQQQGDWGKESKLYQTALHAALQVNRSDSGIDMYSCNCTSIIADDDGNWHESYSASGA